MMFKSKSKKNQKQSWSDLPAGAQCAVIGFGTVQLALLGAALRDIRRRPSDRIRGSKLLWTPLAFVNFLGPAAYFLIGRKR